MSEMNASKRNKEKGMAKGICNKTASKGMKRETFCRKGECVSGDSLFIARGKKGGFRIRLFVFARKGHTSKARRLPVETN